MQVTALDPTSPQPPFEQIRVQIASRVASGELEPGTKLPTVRALAAELDLAANTVARAYRELEADGVILTEGRRGSRVVPSAASEGRDVRSAADEYVALARRRGLGLADAVTLVERAWASHIS